MESMQAYMRLDPYYPTSAIGWLGVANCTLGRLSEAQRYLSDAVARSPSRAMFQYWLAAAYGHMGEADAAHEQARRCSSCSHRSPSPAPLARSRFSGVHRTLTISWKVCADRDFRSERVA